MLREVVDEGRPDQRFVAADLLGFDRRVGNTLASDWSRLNR